VSPALKLLSLLHERGTRVSYYDPHVPALPEHGLCSEPAIEAADDADVAVITTAHTEIDHRAVADRVPAMVDLRGVLRESRASELTRAR
jgi:UDP-N-acetyl-D-glucosamine dehydrogenase